MANAWTTIRCGSVGLVLLVVAACATTDTSSSAVDLEAAFPVEDSIAMLQEQEYQIASCMANEGFDYEPESVAPFQRTREPSGDGLDVSTLYPDETVIIWSGGLPQLGRLEAPLNAATDEGDLPDVNWSIALDSCIAAANVDLEAHAAEFSSFVQEAFDRSDSDPDMIALNREWSSCMFQAGFSHSSWGEAVQHFVERLASFDSDYQQRVDERMLTAPQDIDVDGVRAFTPQEERSIEQLRTEEREFATAGQLCLESTDFVSRSGEIVDRYILLD